MDGNVESRVECYSGFEYAERPLAFFWQGEHLEVEKVLESSVTPEGKLFWVRVKNGSEFTLSYHQQADCWSITPA